jgi:hypothetical protein
MGVLSPENDVVENDVVEAVDRHLETLPIVGVTNA